MNIESITTNQTLDWLLERENPSVRYFTLTKLLNRGESDHEVLEAKLDIMNLGVVPKILEKQNEAGYWGDPQRFYVDKYTGSSWQLIILAELGANPEDIRIKKACEFILDYSQEIESFGFAYYKSGKNQGGRKSDIVPCLTGNMVWSLVKLGFVDDIRVRNGIKFICDFQRSDDGIAESPKGWPYDRYEMCWGRHTCHLGVVKALKALSAIPKEKRDSLTEKKISILAEYILSHHIHKKSHDLAKVSRPGWLKLGFPLMYQSDILEIAGILVDLGYNDPRMSEAIEIINKKKNKAGRWTLENTFNGRMIHNIEVKGKESKWITLKALNVFSKYASD